MVYPVVTTNMLVINTAAGVPIRVEANLRQTLWTKTGWTPAPPMRVDDYPFTENGWVQVTGIRTPPLDTTQGMISSRQRRIFANGYLDPQHKN